MNATHLNYIKRAITLRMAKYYLSLKEVKKAQGEISRYWQLTKPCNSYEPFYIALYGSPSEKAKTLFENGVVRQPDYPL